MRHHPVRVLSHSVVPAGRHATLADLADNSERRNDVTEDFSGVRLGEHHFEFLGATTGLEGAVEGLQDLQAKGLIGEFEGEFEVLGLIG